VLHSSANHVLRIVPSHCSPTALWNAWRHILWLKGWLKLPRLVFLDMRLPCVNPNTQTAANAQNFMASLFPQELLILADTWGQNAAARLHLHAREAANIFVIYFARQIPSRPVQIMGSHVVLFIADTVLLEFHTLPSSLFNPPTIRRAPLPRLHLSVSSSLGLSDSSRTSYLYDCKSFKKWLPELRPRPRPSKPPPILRGSR